jgi:hypothetical protein
MDIIDSLLQFKLDLYVQSEEQDSDSGALKKDWIFDKTISCAAKGIVSNSTSTRTNDRQQFSNKYTMEQLIQIRTTEKITMRHKITNIRNKQNEVIWTELNYPSDTPTVFEVVGVTPIMDPFGVQLGFNVVAKRSENQTVGL